MSGRWHFLALLCVGMGIALASPHALARDAAFLEPGSSGTSSVGDAIRVEPKSEIDLGDSALNVARRTTLFFVNQTNAPIKIEKTTVNSDSNVSAEIGNDDCAKQVSLTPSSRCSLEVVTTPTTSGPWAVEVLMTHNGSGRLTRAKISGKTSNGGSGDKRDTGLFLSTKDVKPVDFGEVTIGEGKLVRSALMVNDSASPITLYSIDVIEASNGLQRLEQGCAVDMELKPGESCPVTLVWTPTDRGHISTDLIIRHNGQLGFVVIPIRGVAHGEAGAGVGTAPGKDTGSSKDVSASKDSGSKKATADASAPSAPPPPSPSDLKTTDKLPVISASALAASSKATTTSGSDIHLIGTVGNRALLYKPDGTTAVVQVGDSVDFDEHKVRIITIGAKELTLAIDGKTKKLTLETVQELTAKGRSARPQPQTSSLSSLSGSSPVSSPPSSGVSSEPKPDMHSDVNALQGMVSGGSK